MHDFAEISTASCGWAAFANRDAEGAVRRANRFACLLSTIFASDGTCADGPTVAKVGAARKCRAAARLISASVTALILPSTSAVGITRPNV